MAAEASRSSPSPDSYIGSLISLTSKSEIRYEGILDNINTEESSIGLRNVRSFGTEGRKKDGHQIPAGDKIYEYILFRGSDIKDLQVKASATVQTAPTYNDPAIIQSNYPRPPAAPSHFPSLGTGPTPEIGSISGQVGMQRPTFQGNLNPYPTGGNLGSWGSTPSPLTANGSGLAVPMYWPGYYAPPGGLPHVQQPPLLRPLPGLAMPPMQQMTQFQGMNASLSSGFSSYPDVHPLFPPVSSNLSLNSASLPSTVAPIQLPSTTALSQAMPFSLEMSQVSVANKVPSASLPAVTPSVSLPTVPHLTPGMETLTSLPQNMHKGPPTSLPAVAPTGSLPPVPHLSPGLETLTSLPQKIPSIASGKPKVGPITLSPPQTESQSTPILGSSSSNQADTPFSLVTPGLLMQPTHSLEKTSIDIDIKSSENKSKPLLPGPPAPEQEAKTKPAAAAKEPILPLPRQSYHKPNGAISGAHENNRGRGRGRGRGTGYPRPQQARFTEDFDFMAMNEKFNKDEVWGHLGKNRSHSNIRDEDDEADGFEEDNAQPPKLDVKPVYVKDDFFDTLSCNTNDQTSNGRIKFSEQLKIDTETFGNFSRHRALYGGGRGHRGGRGRGSYQGRGYGYSGRGRGRGV